MGLTRLLMVFQVRGKLFPIAFFHKHSLRMFLMNSEVSGFIVAAFLLGGLLLRDQFPHIPVWSIMMAAMFLKFLTGLVDVDEAVNYIDFVVFFLIGMFALVSIAESSGLLNYIASLALIIFQQHQVDGRRLIPGLRVDGGFLRQRHRRVTRARDSRSRRKSNRRQIRSIFHASLPRHHNRLRDDAARQPAKHDDSCSVRN